LNYTPSSPYHISIILLDYFLSNIIISHCNDMLVLVISLLGLELLLTSTAVAFISRGSPICFAFLPVMVLATYRVIVVCSSGQLESPIARAVLGSGSVYRIIHYIAIVLLDGWTFEGPTSSLGGLVPITETCEIKVPWSWKSIGDRFRYGVRVSTTTRFSTTRWSIRYIPPFNSAKHGYVPSRSEFLWRSLIRVGILGCFLGLTGKFAQEFWKENAIMFAETRVPFFSRMQRSLWSNWVLELWAFLLIGRSST
jgi:hypothetical protein